MAPIACKGPERNMLTGEGITTVISYWPTGQRTHWHNARICLGENTAQVLKHFDLCYSFKMLCRAEYGGTQQLHVAAENYIWNYPVGQSGGGRITYERALWKHTVLMFSHYINHIECSGALEGHQTLMANECLTVAAAFGCFHRWKRWLEPEARDKPDWMKVPTVSAEDFRHKFSPTLNLLGNPQHLTYAHPKLPGCCFDNVYHQGRLIGDLPVRGKPPSKEHTQKIYNQEYNEIVSRIKNTLDLSDESPTYKLVPTSLCNLEIALPPALFREKRGLPEPTPSPTGPATRTG